VSDPQDQAEQLDGDVVGYEEFPPDHPLGVDEVRGVDIDQDDSVRESLAEREARLVPDDERAVDPDDTQLDTGPHLTPTDEEIVPEAAEEDAVRARDLG
jgi:hypothetical protein